MSWPPIQGGGGGRRRAGGGIRLRTVAPGCWTLLNINVVCISVAPWDHYDNFLGFVIAVSLYNWKVTSELLH